MKERYRIYIGEDKIEKSPLWRAKSDSKKFYDLTANICHALELRVPNICDECGTEVVAIFEDDKKVTNYIPLSFQESGIGALNNEILDFLKGLKIPPFLIKR